VTLPTPGVDCSVAVATIGSPSGLEGLPKDETGKLRLFNAAFLVTLVLFLVVLVCCGVAFVVAFGPKGNVATLLLALACLLFAGLALGDITWGMCVIVAPTEIVVRKHYTSRRIPVDEVGDVEVNERLLAFKPVIGVDLNTKTQGQIRTPLVSARGLAGRDDVKQAAWALNVALTDRRSS
jgi:hypothetical protein